MQGQSSDEVGYLRADPLLRLCAVRDAQMMLLASCTRRAGEVFSVKKPSFDRQHTGPDPVLLHRCRGSLQRQGGGERTCGASHPEDSNGGFVQ